MWNLILVHSRYKRISSIGERKVFSHDIFGYELNCNHPPWFNFGQKAVSLITWLNMIALLLYYVVLCPWNRVALHRSHVNLRIKVSFYFYTKILHLYNYLKYFCCLVSEPINAPVSIHMASSNQFTTKSYAQMRGFWLGGICRHTGRILWRLHCTLLWCIPGIDCRGSCQINIVKPLI